MSDETDYGLGEVVRVFQTDKPLARRRRMPYLVIGAAILGWGLYLFIQGVAYPIPFNMNWGTPLVFAVFGTAMVLWGLRRGFRPSLIFNAGGIEEFWGRIPAMGIGYIAAAGFGLLFQSDARYLVLVIGILVILATALSSPHWKGWEAQAVLYRDGFTYTRRNHTRAIAWESVKYVRLQSRYVGSAELTFSQKDGKTLYFQDQELQDYASLVEAILQNVPRPIA